MTDLKYIKVIKEENIVHLNDLEHLASFMDLISRGEPLSNEPKNPIKNPIDLDQDLRDADGYISPKALYDSED